jgi:hypothetical protein
VQNVHVHDNTVDLSGGGGTGGAEDMNILSVFTSNNNTFQNNTYYLGSNSQAFSWMDQTGDTAWWQSQGQDITGTFYNTAIPADVLSAFHPVVSS